MNMKDKEKGHNTGEWSEVYAFFKMLGEGCIYAGDENLNKIQSLVYPLIKIIRTELDEEEYVYDLKKRGDGPDVVLITSDDVELMRVKATEFLHQAEYLLDAIREYLDYSKQRKAGEMVVLEKVVPLERSFRIPQTEKWMHTIKCQKVKAESTSKTDITVYLHDVSARQDRAMNFSIKSYLGNAPTLLNSSRQTLFVYKLQGGTMSDEELEEINSIVTVSKIHDRIMAACKKNRRLAFSQIESKIFRDNLVMIESLLPEILGRLLLLRDEQDETDIRELTGIIARENPMNYNGESDMPFYEFKVKQFLTCVALGMLPGTPWKGIYDANGGFIVVKQDGDLICYHFYDRNRFENYLFNNTKFDRPADRGKGTGKFIRDDAGNVIFKLSMQIRFK